MIDIDGLHGKGVEVYNRTTSRDRRVYQMYIWLRAHMGGFMEGHVEIKGGIIDSSAILT